MIACGILTKELLEKTTSTTPLKRYEVSKSQTLAILQQKKSNKTTPNSNIFNASQIFPYGNGSAVEL
jgi:ribosomal protein S3AE